MHIYTGTIFLCMNDKVMMGHSSQRSKVTDSCKEIKLQQMSISHQEFHEFKKKIFIQDFFNQVETGM